MEDKQTYNDENFKNGDVPDAKECVLSLQKSLTQLEEKSDKMSGINVEEYLTADDDLMVFAGDTEEDILSKIKDEMENDDTNRSQSLLTSKEGLQSVQSLWAFFSSLSSTNDYHSRALNSMQTLLVDLTVKKINKQN
ncbi:hypothetical protein AVEN_155140-1 [Araneus ventricosus]|uniref:Uncharacterized protein n=1 Tax=Araneus ventricosus TaxID=182803 RepID=A0A4Y2PUX9_ARAVE|nr:hypothetical protein AVEN_155140-1 [Araneus ventricosus]